MTNGLITKIGRRSDKDSMSRRDFLKVAGAATAVTAAGCADTGDYKEKIYPNVKGLPNQVPGTAVWYRSTCTECSAGCGIEVRTREGRAVKIEGSAQNPVNRGGLCALGQSSLQHLYDPDRVRQPIQKVTEGGKIVWKPIGWIEAYEKVATALASKGAKKAFITGELSGSLESLVARWSQVNNLRHVQFDAMSPVAEAKASEAVYGAYGIPFYAFDKAETVLNFGADFLETWVSPCGYARDWAQSRRSKKPVRVFHVEPRLSLTGANADTWLQCNPGSELYIALGILKLIAERKDGGEAVARAKALTADISLDEVVAESGVEKAKILLIAEKLARASASIVLSGGSGAQASNGQSLHTVTALMNVVLGNIGKTIDLSRMRAPQSDAQGVEGLLADMRKGGYAILMVDSSNPAFTLPQGLGFAYAAKATKLVVSFSDKLDETSQLADLILPSSTSLESWGDMMPYAGVHNIIQPVMTPVFDTRALGDIIVDFFNGMKQEAGIEGAKSFKDVIQASWKKVHASSGVGGAFEDFWSKAVERGGYFVESRFGTQQASLGSMSSVPVKAAMYYKEGAGDDSLVVYPYPSTKSFDGRSANRPWLQELPDPITQVVWDAWAELHPTTAKKLGVEQGDVVTIRNDNGEINVPVYVTEHVHPKIVAIPLGQGHDSFGRYAEQVKGANAWTLLSHDRGKAPTFGLLSSMASVKRSRVKTHLVNMDGSRSQLDRHLAQTKYIDTVKDVNDHHDDHHNDHGHHEPKQMYDQRVHAQYRWGMAIDLAACTGCSACVVACYAENNIPVVGKEFARQGREMAWLRIDRYYDNGDGEELTVAFQPMLCQHCGNAPCEPVCPVYATYHNEQGLNVMVCNRCVGTRYCANNCTYKVRRFNWFEYDTPEPLNWQFNPDVTTRSVGVMEKCTFCSHRIAEGVDRAKDLGRPVLDGDIVPACVQSCPTEALAFGDLNDPKSKVSKLAHDKRGYKVLDHHLNTLPAITYLKDIKYKNV